ncbi:hypothetical protein [Pleomorphomonas koreensis]|uniref:hypothetical protein n=1 Tax=Pleomorphomonas koreensis TaxID=257440 RepID=UPI00040CFB65|nr:hypothetical protein [Pleomorphomonas koreensis]
MTSGTFRLAMTLAAALLAAAPALAARQRHQLIEPIQPDRRHEEKAAPSRPGDRLCFCRTVHQRNAAGRLTWQVVCSDKGPAQGAHKIRAPDCRTIRNLPPR